jgi:ankyrin repeat protein
MGLVGGFWRGLCGLGRTPLLSAAGNGHVEVVELLLKSGASVEAQNDNGDGPRTDGTTNLV